MCSGDKLRVEAVHLGWVRSVWWAEDMLFHKTMEEECRRHNGNLYICTTCYQSLPGGKVASKSHSSIPTLPVVTQVEPLVELTGSTQCWYPMPGVSNMVQWTEDASTWILKDISKCLRVSARTRPPHRSLTSAVPRRTLRAKLLQRASD